MAWKDEAALPFTPVILYFSPILIESGNSVVYLIDRSTNFYKYNLTTQVYTQLTSPADSHNLYRSLAPNSDATKLACPTADRTKVAVYTISSNDWVESSVAPTITGSAGSIKSLVWENDDLIWVWASNGQSGLVGKCIRWVPSTNTWTVFSASTGNQSLWQGRSAAYKTDAVYGLMIGAVDGGSDMPHCKYVPSTDTYSLVMKQNLNGGYTYDRDKLWYNDAGGGSGNTYRQGYFQISNESYHNNVFVEDTSRAINSSKFGVADDLTKIIIDSGVSSELRSTSSAKVTTQAVTAIASTTATGNGTIADTGLSSITAHGHVWNTSVDPDTGDSSVDNGAGSAGVFTSSITGLSLGQTYFARAYIINTQGTFYGANVKFIAGQGGQLISGNLAVVQTRLHYVDEDGKERGAELPLI